MNRKQRAQLKARKKKVLQTLFKLKLNQRIKSKPGRKHVRPLVTFESLKKNNNEKKFKELTHFSFQLFETKIVRPLIAYLPKYAKISKRDLLFRYLVNVHYNSSDLTSSLFGNSNSGLVRSRILISKLICTYMNNVTPIKHEKRHLYQSCGSFYAFKNILYAGDVVRFKIGRPAKEIQYLSYDSHKQQHQMTYLVFFYFVFIFFK